MMKFLGSDTVRAISPNFLHNLALALASLMCELSEIRIRMIRLS